MDEKIGEINSSKAQFLSDALNRVLAVLIGRSSKSEGVRNYFEIGVIGYGGNGIGNALPPPFASKLFNPIADFEKNLVGVEDRWKKVPDGAGGITELSVKFPIWFTPQASGGTPMCDAIRLAAQEIAKWCDEHQNSYPPTILHVTDGESTDGEPESLANQLMQISTNDGKVLLFNLHVSTNNIAPVKFPSSESQLSDKYAKLLFRMSSSLPSGVAAAAREKGYAISLESRGCFFNANPIDIVDFFDIGTRASTLLLR
jgi:hypothetical protein